MSNIEDLKKLFSQFTSGINVIASINDMGDPEGFTANAFSSVSLKPPIILICVDKTNENYDLFYKCKYFSVNILNKNQQNLSNIFASKSPKKFEGIPWKKENLNVPILEGSIAWLECENYDQIIIGDHMVLFGKIKNYKINKGSPLVYFRGNYVNITK